MATHQLALMFRWIARVWSVLSVLVILAFAVNSFSPTGGPTPTAQEWIGLALFPIGLSIGLILAWRHEAARGVISVACIVGFYIWNLAHSGHLPHGPFFYLLAAPSLLFIAAALFYRRSARPRT